MKLDVLAFAAHPDDTELSCSGTLLAHKAQGKTVGVVEVPGVHQNSDSRKQLGQRKFLA